MQKTPNSGWAAMPMTPDLTNALGAMLETAMFTDAAGNVIVYGVSQQFNQPTFVMLAAQGAQPWDLVFEGVAASGATYRLLPGQSGEQLTVMTLQGVTATFQGRSIADGMFQWGSQPAISHDLGQGDIAAQEVFAMPSTSNDPGFLAAEQHRHALSGRGVPRRPTDCHSDDRRRESACRRPAGCHRARQREPLDGVRHRDYEHQALAAPPIAGFDGDPRGHVQRLGRARQ